MVRPTLTLAALMFFTASMFPQTAPPARPSFEVASIKPSAPGSTGRFITSTPSGTFIATNYPLKGLAGYAYRARNYQLSGGAGWIETDGWEIRAKAEEGSIPPRVGRVDPTRPDPFGLMLQSLLEDRFKLKVHRETREMQVYELVAPRGGSKLHLADDQSPIVFGTGAPPSTGPAPGGGPPLSRGGYRIRSGPDQALEALAMDVPLLVNILINALNRPVLDKTDLKGLYDIKLQWAQETAPVVGPDGGAPSRPVSTAPPIFVAVQEQLGLRLVSTKGPVEVIVIDSAERPTPN